MCSLRNVNFVCIPLDCGDDGSVYFEHTGKCYKFYNQLKLSWSDARWNCEELGRNGDLVSITDDVTAKFIKENFNFTNRGTWLGGRAKSGKGYWKWADESKWLHQTWQDGQPNEVGEAGAYFYGDNWYDGPMTTTLFSLCQY